MRIRTADSRRLSACGCYPQFHFPLFPKFLPEPTSGRKMPASLESRRKMPRGEAMNVAADGRGALTATRPPCCQLFSAAGPSATHTEQPIPPASSQSSVCGERNTDALVCAFWVVLVLVLVRTCARAKLPVSTVEWGAATENLDLGGETPGKSSSQATSYPEARWRDRSEQPAAPRSCPGRRWELLRREEIVAHQTLPTPVPTIRAQKVN